MFTDLVGEGGNPCVLNSDLVERFEAMYDAQRFAIFLDDAKPSRSVRRVGWLVHTGVELAPNDLTYFFVDTGWNWDVSLRPWFVRYCRYFDWREEVFAKVSTLSICPSETLVLEAHKMVHKCALFR